MLNLVALAVSGVPESSDDRGAIAQTLQHGIVSASLLFAFVHVHVL